jgi:hypothetical protein
MNQRVLFTLLAVGALGYVGYILWADHGVEWLAKLNPPPATAESTPAPATTPAPESKPASPAPQPEESRYAPPGIYYMLERVSVETDRGVKAVDAGEEVKLMMRKGGGVMRVTIDGKDFDVKEGQVTNDLHVVRELAKKAPASRGAGK